LIENGVNGFLCPPGEPDCLSQKIGAMIDDSDLRERMGRNARRSYEQGGFQPDSVCRHLAGIYSGALRGSSADAR